jgi:hypothetical protein
MLCRLLFVLIDLLVCNYVLPTIRCDWRDRKNLPDVRMRPAGWTILAYINSILLKMWVADSVKVCLEVSKNGVTINWHRNFAQLECVHIYKCRLRTRVFPPLRSTQCPWPLMNSPALFCWQQVNYVGRCRSANWWSGFNLSLMSCPQLIISDNDSLLDNAPCSRWSTFQRYLLPPSSWLDAI